MGLYLMHVLDPNGQTWLDPVLPPVERLTYRAMGVDARKEHIGALHARHAALQSRGVLVHLRDSALAVVFASESAGDWRRPPDLSFNTAASFTTNTNWQTYVGESTMSYFSQMVGLAFHNFVSAATGIAIAAALVGDCAVRLRRLAISGSTWFGSLTTCCCRSVWCLLLFWCRRE